MCRMQIFALLRQISILRYQIQQLTEGDVMHAGKFAKLSIFFQNFATIYKKFFTTLD